MSNAQIPTAAPGYNILGNAPPNPEYARMSGTSRATPDEALISRACIAAQQMSEGEQLRVENLVKMLRSSKEGGARNAYLHAQKKLAEVANKLEAVA